MDNLFHPSPEELEGFAAEDADAADAAVVESHLLQCVRCRTMVEEWRSLFAALAELPELVPEVSFADRVMARVRVRKPFAARAAAFAERLLPRTRRGWAVVLTALGLPTLAALGLIGWILAQPWLTLQGLVTFGARQLGSAMTTLPQRGLGMVADTTVGVWVNQAMQRMSELGAGPIGAGVALAATLMVVSGWVLYQNLVRPNTRSEGYANYCF